MNYLISREEVIKMLKKEEFAVRKYQWVDYPEFEKLNSLGDVVNVFEELAEQLGRIPTQTEYVNECLARSKAFFIGKAKPNGDRWLPIGKYPNGKPIWHNFVWEDRLETALIHRHARTYISKQVEYTTTITLKDMYKKAKVGGNQAIDLIMGVDIVLALLDKNVMFYFHVFKDSNMGSKYRSAKKSRGGTYNKNGKYVQFNRSSGDSHIDLKFTTNKSNSTDIVNGNPVLKPEYIESQIDLALLLKSDFDTCKEMSELMELHEWLIDNDVNEDGLKGESFWF